MRLAIFRRPSFPLIWQSYHVALWGPRVQGFVTRTAPGSDRKRQGCDAAVRREPQPRPA